LVEIITNPILLSEVLATTLNPVAQDLRGRAADAALVVCDSENEVAVQKAIGAARGHVAKPVEHAVCNPEFEAALFNKIALEHAADLNPCAVSLPSSSEIRNGAKEALARCLAQAGYGGRLSASLQRRVVESLPESHLRGSNPTIQGIREALGRLAET
jgi:hypothetical protein